MHAGAKSTELFIVQWARGKGSSPGRVEGSSRAMLATARPSCSLEREPSLCVNALVAALRPLHCIKCGEDRFSNFTV